MADHEVELTYDGYTARSRFFCTAPPTADCRQSFLDPDCLCEEVSEYVRDREGTIIGHLLRDARVEFDEVGNEVLVDVFHAQGPAEECMIVTWLDNSEESFDGPDLTLPRMPIQVSWEGDSYCWRGLL